MQELLSKIGIPTAIGTVISLVVVVVPMLFKIDERYAKQEALESAVRQLETENSRLRAELAQNAGFQQAMIAFIQQGRIPRPAVEANAPRSVGAGAPAPRPIVPAPVVPAPAASPPASPPEPMPESPPPRTWQELNDGIGKQQDRLRRSLKEQ